MPENTLTQKVADAIRLFQYTGVEMIGAPFSLRLMFKDGVPDTLLRAWLLRTDCGDGCKPVFPGDEIVGACRYLVDRGDATSEPLTTSPRSCEIERPDGARIKLHFPRPTGESQIEACISLTGRHGNLDFYHAWCGRPTTAYAHRGARVSGEATAPDAGPAATVPSGDQPRRLKIPPRASKAHAAYEIAERHGCETDAAAFDWITTNLDQLEGYVPPEQGDTFSKYLREYRRATETQKRPSIFHTPSRSVVSPDRL